MANYGVEIEREKQDAIRSMGGQKKFDAHQKKFAAKVAKRKAELAKKIHAKRV